jgi:hypothetical protein
MRLVEQGRAEGCINSDLSDEAIHLYIRAIREVLTQPDISKKARLDLNLLAGSQPDGKVSRCPK